MTGPLLLFAAGLALATASAAVAVASAAVSQIELTRWVAYRLRGVAAAGRLLHNPGRVIAISNAATTLGVLLAAGALPGLLAHLDPTTVGLLVFLLGVPLILSTAYLVPRVVGRRWAERIVARAVPWMEALGRPLAPFIPSRDPSTRTALAAVISNADPQALARSDEIEIVAGVLAFADRPVRELMTPRTAIVAIPEGMLAAEAAHVFAQSGYSRYPVYRGSLDEIVGVAHSFDLLGLEPEAPVPVHPVLTVPAPTRAAELMREMQRGRGHLAAVLDEYGGTAGVVTLENLLKDLVSAVFVAPPEQAEPDDATPVVELEGSAPAARLEEAFGLPRDGGRAESVGGLLVHLLGRIPRAGERFLYRGLEIDVLAASATRVERVAARRGPVRAQVLEPGEPGTRP